MTLELQASPDGVVIPVRVRPGASREGIVGVHDGALRVNVHAPPEGGKANKSVVAVLAKALGVAKSDLEIIAGTTSAQKRLKALGVTVSDCRAALQPYLKE